MRADHLRAKGRPIKSLVVMDPELDGLSVCPTCKGLTANFEPASYCEEKLLLLDCKECGGEGIVDPADYDI